MATTTYGSPYAQSADLVSAWPATSLTVADRIDDVSFKGNGLNNQTASYTGVLLDAGKTVMMNVATSNTFTIPASSSIAYELGTVLRISNKGAGTTTVQPNGGVTLNGGNISLTQYQSCEVQLVATDIWVATVKPAPAAVASGLTLITTSTFSAVSTVSVNSCFTSSYENYRILVETGSNANDMKMRLRASGSDNTTSNYNRTGMYVNGSGIGGYGTGSSTDFWYVGNSDGGCAFSTDVYRPQTATKTNMTNLCNTSSPNSFFTTGSFESTTQFDGFTLYYSTGTNSGTLRVYGYQNS